MHRFKLPLIIAVASVCIFALLWKNQNQSSPWSSDLFRLKNPDQISAILLASNDDSKGYVKFIKTTKGWTVSDGHSEYVADTQSLNDLLHWAMPRLHLKNPVPDAAKENITRELAQAGTKAVFYIGQKEVHTIYVGSPTPTQESTYMYAPDTERPCVVEIPGFTGYLTPYFHTDIQQWRSVFLIDVAASDIKSIQVEYPEHPDNNFLITQNPSTFTAQLFAGPNQQAIKNAQTGLLLGYIEMSKQLSREAGENAGINRNSEAKTNVLTGPVLAKITYSYFSGKTEAILIYPMPVGSETYSLDTRDGKPKMNETDLFWASHSAEPDRLWVIQSLHLKNRLKKRSEFITP